MKSLSSYSLLYILIRKTNTELDQKLQAHKFKLIEEHLLNNLEKV